MAIAPIKNRFLQQASERKAQQNITNFRLRTGQRFPDIARGQLFEQQLQQEDVEKREDVRVALQFRQQEETERQARVRESEAEQGRITARRQRKKEEKFDIVKVAGTIARAFT